MLPRYCLLSCIYCPPPKFLECKALLRQCGFEIALLNVAASDTSWDWVKAQNHHFLRDSVELEGGKWPHTSSPLTLNSLVGQGFESIVCWPSRGKGVRSAFLNRGFCKGAVKSRKRLVLPLPQRAWLGTDISETTFSKSKLWEHF